MRRFGKRAKPGSIQGGPFSGENQAIWSLCNRIGVPGFNREVNILKADVGLSAAKAI
jgi:hypothetical protein